MSAVYLTEKQLCDRWNVCRKTLWQQRKKGTGPMFSRIGGTIRYMVSDIAAYEKQIGLNHSENSIELDISDSRWLQYSTVNISNNFLYLVLYSLIYTIKTKNLGNSEYLAFKQLALLIRDRLIVNIPSLRASLKKMSGDI